MHNSDHPPCPICEYRCPICDAAGKLCPQCVKKFYPGRIIQGRMARGMNRKEFAEATGFSYYKLTEWEKGRQRPDEDQIATLCLVLHFTRRFFSRPPFTFEGPTFFCGSA